MVAWNPRVPTTPDGDPQTEEGDPDAMDDEAKTQLHLSIRYKTEPMRPRPKARLGD